MFFNKVLNVLFSLLIAGSLLLGSSSQISTNQINPPAAVVNALPTSPVDETKVPHYFGPNTNWALSPFTLPDVFVTIDPPLDVTGRQAIAQATVGANGAVTGITITDPGSGYSSLTPPTVTISNAAGTNSSATAQAQVTDTGVVIAININVIGGVPQTGAGYTAPNVIITGGGATTDATATAYGGVDAVSVVDGGIGYTMPVVDFDFPDDPNGTIAKAHALMDTSGTITAVVVDDPGSGYSVSPNVVIHDGPIYAPLNNRQLNAAYAARAKVIEGNKASPLSSDDVAAIGPAATTNAIATATLKILSVTVNTFGAGYTSPPTVDITDLNNPGLTTKATATAAVDAGGVTAILNLVGGSGYITTGGIKKFTDPLPDLCDPAVTGSCPVFLTDPNSVPPNLPLPTELQPKYIPLGVPEAMMYNGIESDQYEIGLVQYRTSFSSSLKDANGPVGTLARGYVQLDTGCTIAGGTGRIPGSQCFPLQNELLNGTLVDTGYFGVTPPQWLGPTLAATKNKPVRIIFRNLLPKGSDGNLFLPVDTTLMGSGMGPTGMWAPFEDGTVMDEVRNPLCTQIDPITHLKIDMCFKDNRATLHLHGGITPWISDGTPHQWITPANETTPWPQGVSVGNVPDMTAAGCDAADDGCMTFYYTNQQSARLQFYHDHAYGITRLNVMAGEAAGYVISDETEKSLLPATVNNPTGRGLIPGPADTKVLVIQDRTFVAQDSQMYNQIDTDPLSPTYGQVISYGLDPTWDASRWGGYGNTWFHHVYMPAQNPGDPGGMSAYGRWMYGPWFWPPAANTVYGPITNPYYGKDPDGLDNIKGNADDWMNPQVCNLDDPSTWQYQTDPFCEPQLIPGTPNISVGMEQFNDTPTVNGVAYPTITLEPKTYRLRMLNAANDRFFNFQWYVADPSTLADPLDPTSGTEVAFNEAELAAAQTDPNIFPTPDTVCETGDTSCSLPGPDWIQIGNEGGFLPAPVVIDGQQVTTWITDPTRFDVGNVDKHSLLLAPAERADVIVDFSQFEGQTLILYNDGPAAFPARVPSYDYYTGAPDLSPNGAPGVLPGYGPNTRTILQVKIVGTKQPAFNLTKLSSAFSHKANGTGVFESGQHPIIVGQAAYNSAYGTSFATAGDCSTALAGDTKNCDGLVRVNDTAAFNFNTLKAQSIVMNLKLEPKAIHDEMNSTTFDDYGRMQATLGLEAQPPTPGVQNATLYPYVNPVTELIDATNLPKNDVLFDPITGLPVSDVKITPISSAADGTQIWRITHNGVDTHPVHFHLFDVQALNRVTWDNIIIPTEASELGWKETLRVSPLEDTIVALRPIIPELPWELPNAIRDMNPAMPGGATAAFNNVDPQGNPTAPIVNQLVNFGWEYVYHCHILSHEEMDMMRPVSAVLPPIQPDGLVFNSSTATLTWNDNSINETSFVVQRTTDSVTWIDVGTSPSPLNQPNAHGLRSLIDPTFNMFTDYQYRVVAKNTVGYGLEFPSLTVQSLSSPLVVQGLPAAPSNLTATLAAGPQVNLAWIDNANNETNFVIERATNTGPFAQIAVVGANIVTYVDSTVLPGTTYTYRVAAVNAVGLSPYSNTAQVVVPGAPAAPTNLTAIILTAPVRVQLTWRDNATNETGFVIERSVNGGAFIVLATLAPRTNVGNVTYNDSTVLAGNSYTYRVAALNGTIQSAYSNIVTVTVSVPLAPSNLQAFPVLISTTSQRVALTWVDNSTNETGFTIQWSADVNFTTISGTLNRGANATTAITGNIARQVWFFRIRADNAIGSSSWTSTGGIQPAALMEEPKSPLVFLNSFDLGLSGWTGQVGNVQATTAAAMDDRGWLGLEASLNADEPENSDQGSYVFHQIPEELGSYMTDFYFNPNDALIASPVDIFSGLDAAGEKIFGVQFQMLTGSPDLYQIRGWARTEQSDIFTDWVTISNARQNIQLDWQSEVVSSLNLYVEGEMVASTGGDTSLYKLVEEQFGLSTTTGEDDLDISPTAGTTTTLQTVYLDEFISLSTQITQPYTPVVITFIYLPVVTNP
jgi:FtsP/CotA-like multicopper oxidase with cupredoxin domain